MPQAKPPFYPGVAVSRRPGSCQARRGTPFYHVLLAAVAILILGPGQAEAIVYNWTGNGGDVNWSTAGNWTGGAPVDSTATDLVFAGTNNTGAVATPLNENVVGTLTVNTLTFSGGGGPFFLGGGPGVHRKQPYDHAKLSQRPEHRE